MGRLKAVVLLSDPGEQCEVMLFSYWLLPSGDSSQNAHSKFKRTCRPEKRTADDEVHLCESNKRQALEQQEPAVDAASPKHAEGKQAGAQDGARGEGAGDQPPEKAQQKACI